MMEAEEAKETIADIVTEKRKLYDSQYRENHRMEIRARCKIYREKNRKLRNANARLYHKEHPLKNIFYVMRQRCGVTKGAGKQALALYAERGITVEWTSSSEFEKWAINNGWRKGLQIDRIDNNGNYGPNNCRFVTPKENSRNRRNTRWVVFNGKRMSLAELAETTGIKRQQLSYQIGKGKTTEEAVAWLKK